MALTLKYKIGDKVLLKNNLNRRGLYGGWRINKLGRMDYLIGKKVKIKELVRKQIFIGNEPTGKYNYGYAIKGKLGLTKYWFINDEMINRKVR